jgi:mono/diheme cytochrome c family protein
MKAGLGVCLLILAVIVLGAASPATQAAKLERGKYLVDQVALCGDCHTPRTEKGEPIKEKYLKGSPLFFKPTVPIPGWADKSPNIAGLPGWEEKDAIKFFMTGLAYNDLPGRPPMPQYRFNKEDATAIVTYLRSVGAEGKGSGEQK